MLLLCDLGPTLFFASTGAYKQVRCAQAAAILAWLAFWAGDQVGGIVFNGQRLSVLRPARRKNAVLRLLDALADRQYTPDDPPDPDTPADTAGLNQALIEARRVAHTGQPHRYPQRLPRPDRRHPAPAGLVGPPQPGHGAEDSRSAGAAVAGAGALRGGHRDRAALV